MIEPGKFAQARLAAGHTQKTLAKAAGVSQQLIGHIESGQVRTTKKIYILANALNMPPHALDSDIPAPQSDMEELHQAMMALDRDERQRLYAYFKTQVAVALKKPRNTTAD